MSVLGIGLSLSDKYLFVAFTRKKGTKRLGFFVFIKVRNFMKIPTDCRIVQSINLD